ncbi:MAG: hypothetical protein PGMFKBFP_02082 [Anaerolineales bacterium]|nr:hypothetical protein [Anaerolineales bacterium]
MDDLLQQGITAYKAGKRDEARKIFLAIVKQSPDNERAWGWMYNVSNNDKERIYCLKQVLRINPKEEKAKQLLNQLITPPLTTSSLPSPSLSRKDNSNKTSTKKTNVTIWAFVAATVFPITCLCLFLIPQIRTFLTKPFILSTPTTLPSSTPTLKPTETPIPLYSGNPENFIPSTSELPEGFVIMTDKSGPHGSNGYTAMYTKFDYVKNQFQLVGFSSYVQEDIPTAQQQYKQIVQNANDLPQSDVNVNVPNVDEYTAKREDTENDNIVLVIFRKLNFVGTVLFSGTDNSILESEKQAELYLSLYLTKIQKQSQNTSFLQPTPHPDIPTVVLANTPESTNVPLLPTTSLAPIILTGSGDSITDFENPFEFAIVHITGNTSSRFFAVKSYGNDGRMNDLLVNTTDPYDGIRLLDFGRGEHSTRFEVSAADGWSIEILPLSSARLLTIPGIIEGKGDEVILIKGAIPYLAKIKGNANGRFFAVKSYGKYSDLLVNTTDPYEGTVKISSDVFVLEILASDYWSIEIITQ